MLIMLMLIMLIVMPIVMLIIRVESRGTLDSHLLAIPTPGLSFP